MRTEGSKHSLRTVVIVGGAIFVLAFGVRILAWQDARLESTKVQSSVANNYRNAAQILLVEGIGAFFSRKSALANPDTAGHPPGYPMLLAFVWRMTGGSQTTMSILQLVADATSAIFVFVLALKILTFGAAVIGGVLVALAPQFTWNAALPLPDSLAALMLLIAVYFLACAVSRPRLVMFALAGIAAGFSVWFRANALLLAPFLFMATMVLVERQTRLRSAVVVAVAAMLVVLPLTIRNAIVHHALIPVSLGAGQTLLEGIADYDPENRFGIPATDLGIMQQEAQKADRPDYAQTLFGADAVARERARLMRAWSVIAANPIWFSTVMFRRGISMLRLERARTVSRLPAVTRLLPFESDLRLKQRVNLLVPVKDNNRAPVWYHPESSDGAKPLLLAPDDTLADPTSPFPTLTVDGGTDYFLEVPARIEKGRVKLEVVRTDDSSALASTIVEASELPTTATSNAQLPFVSEERGTVSLRLVAVPSEPPIPVVEIDRIELYRLGPATMVWTRFPRLLINAAQKLFVTAIVLPLALLGTVFLFRDGKKHALILLLLVPVYYMCVQSALHTEYRYVLAIEYFLLTLAAGSIFRLGSLGWEAIARSRSVATV